MKQNTKANLYNAYGPTESTIWTHIGDLRDDFVNVGKPLPGIKDFILDDDCNQVEKGELWLAGKTLANGYCNNPELTAQKFVKIGDEIFYKTGDVAFRKEGKLVILGRIDNQIKIHGKRIELEEIEATVLECLNIKQCVIFMDKGDLILATHDKGITLKELKEQLCNHIDSSFIPKKVIVMEEFPMTNNGKVDRKKMKENYNKINNIEEKILKLLKELVLTEVTRDDLIVDLGLSSIEYLMLIVQIEKTFNIEFEDDSLIMSAFSTVGDFIQYIKERVG